MSLVSVQKAEISAEINSTSLQCLLWGIYTVVYSGTLYLYLAKYSSRKWLIIGAISLSYLAFTTSVIIFWYLDQFSIVNSETRDALFVALEQGPQWAAFIDDIVTFIMAAVADGILIWRCFHVWGASVRVIVLPTFLLFCEILLDLGIIILLGVDHLLPPLSQVNLINRLLGTQAFLTFVTTLVTTLLIAYRLYASWEQDLPERSKRRIKQILEILTQSAVVYSLVALAQAISFVLPGASGSSNLSLVASQAYLNVLFLFVSGVAPVMVVARVASLSDRERHSEEVRTRISGLQFQVNSTAQEMSQEEIEDYQHESRKIVGAHSFTDKNAADGNIQIKTV